MGAAAILTSLPHAASVASARPPVPHEEVAAAEVRASAGTPRPNDAVVLSHSVSRGISPPAARDTAVGALLRLRRPPSPARGSTSPTPSTRPHPAQTKRIPQPRHMARVLALASPLQTDALSQHGQVILALADPHQSKFGRHGANIDLCARFDNWCKAPSRRDQPSAASRSAERALDPLAYSQLRRSCVSTSS